MSINVIDLTLESGQVVDLALEPTPEIVLEVSTVSPPGPQGVQGEKGDSGGAYTHTQNTPSEVWTVIHNLGFKVNPIVTDPDGVIVYGWKPTWASDNVLLLLFPTPRTGYCHVS